MAASWRTVRVFISSTFRDMHAEREELVKRIFPQLRKLCEDRGVTFAEVDLRWGITEEQAAEGKVLPICLAEIDRCRPYFISILGEHYGWVPEHIDDELVDQQPWLAEHRERSVTELAILHGALNNPETANRAYFYFRDPAFIDSLPPEQQEDFTAESAEAAEKLERLKQRIRESGLAVRENYGDPQTLGQWVLEDLTTAINQEFPIGTEPPAGFFLSVPLGWARGGTEPVVRGIVAPDGRFCFNACMGTVSSREAALPLFSRSCSGAQVRSWGGCCRPKTMPADGRPPRPRGTVGGEQEHRDRSAVGSAFVTRAMLRARRCRIPTFAGAVDALCLARGMDHRQQEGAWSEECLSGTAPRFP